MPPGGGLLIAHFFGFAGLAAIVFAWQFQSRSMILVFNLFAFVLFAIEQYLLGSYVGAGMMLAAVLLALAALRTPRWQLGVALVAVPIGLATPSIRHWYDLLPMIAHCTGAVAFFQKSTRKLRHWAPVGTVLWAVYNAIIGAWGQFMADLFILTSMALGYARNRKSSTGRIR